MTSLPSLLLQWRNRKEVLRYGKLENLAQGCSGISVEGAGYYDVSVSVVAVPAAAGTVTVQLMQDGVAVSGANASATVAATDTDVTLAFPAALRLGCCATGSTLTLVLTGAASTINNVAVRVTKI